MRRPCRPSRLPGDDPREGRFPRQADENGPSEGDDPIEPAYELQVLIRRLAEPDPGIQADRVLGDPRVDGVGETFLEEGDDVGDDVLVARLDLHRARLALHVHQTDVRSRVADDRCKLRIAPERRHVVHHLRAERERATRDLRPGRVHRHRDSLQELDDRDHAPKLLVEVDCLCSRSGRFAADVDEPCSLLDHSPRDLGGVERGRVCAAVGEAVRRDVDDAHHGRARPTFGE